MTIRITQFNERDRGLTVLHVEGKLYLSDARILQQTFNELKSSSDVEINLSEISFLNSDSASVLMGLRRQGATLTGLDFFKQKILELIESQT